MAWRWSVGDGVLCGKKNDDDSDGGKWLLLWRVRFSLKNKRSEVKCRELRSKDEALESNLLLGTVEDL